MHLANLQKCMFACECMYVGFLAGYHMRCLPAEDQLDTVPEDDWHCPECRERSVYEAEVVRDKKKKGKPSRMHYLVHWKGYPNDDDSWEPISHLSVGARKLVTAFNARLRDAQ